ncbi:hypothetical protein U14_00561 [Candidatus Moduliflexus flocculans]|uniref:Uncharacterized protein n=1 Tax=Candidatus Moduliflexus flocculans TaxID=1499966 RepID=A0A0S6VQB3_9BACT|nr:hypothetical protein U14_00561 [Candidatus Moduliflexus flocculans]
MINIARCFQDIRLFKAVTGMIYAEFNVLLPRFVDALGAEGERRDVRSSASDGRGAHTYVAHWAREALFFSSST